MNNKVFRDYKEKWKDNPHWGCFHCGHAITQEQVMFSISKEEVTALTRNMRAGSVYFHEVCFESIASSYWNIDLSSE